MPTKNKKDLVVKNCRIFFCCYHGEIVVWMDKNSNRGYNEK